MILMRKNRALNNDKKFGKLRYVNHSDNAFSRQKTIQVM